MLLAFVLLFGAVLVAVVPQPSAGSVPDRVPNQAAPLDLSDEEVFIGAYVENIQTIDPATSSFLADVYVWYRWKNKDLRPNETVEIMNWFEAWQMMELGHQTEPREQPDGTY